MRILATLYLYQHWVWLIHYYYYFSHLKSKIVVSYCDFNFPNNYRCFFDFLIFSLVKWLLKYFGPLFILDCFLLVEI